MTLECPTCGSTIPQRQIDERDGIAKCETCGALYDLVMPQSTTPSFSDMLQTQVPITGNDAEIDPPFRSWRARRLSEKPLTMPKNMQINEGNGCLSIRYKQSAWQPIIGLLIFVSILGYLSYKVITEYAFEQLADTFAGTAIWWILRQYHVVIVFDETFKYHDHHCR